MQQYDLNVILNANISEAQLQTEKDAIAGQVERAGGEIVAVDEVGTRRLAYPIEKETEGCYLFYTVRLAAQAPRALEKGLRLRDNIMRVLIVRDRPEWRTRKAKRQAEAEVASA